MTRWAKELERWRTASGKQNAEEVGALLYRVFGSRVEERKGTSHRYKVNVPELRTYKGFEAGFFNVAVSGDQAVKPVYLQNAYRAAKLLEQLAAEEEIEKQGNDDADPG